MWRLAWRQVARDFRAGELRLLVVAVMLAVAALTAVGFFADRINGGLARDARQLLGGDAIVASDQPAPPAFAQKARELGLAVGDDRELPEHGPRAATAQGGATRLVGGQGGERRPIRCAARLRVSAGRGTRRGSRSRGAPAPGTAWVDPALLDALGAEGRRRAAARRRDACASRASIVIEPDRGAGFSSFAPRVMLNEADLPATGLVQPASRVTYRLAVAAPGGDATPRCAQFVDWAEAQVKSRRRCAACASSRSRAAGPRCGRRSTAPRNS